MEWISEPAELVEPSGCIVWVCPQKFCGDYWCFIYIGN